MPVTGAGSSVLTLSVSTSTIASSSVTFAPGLTSHFTIVPSATDSPSRGIVILMVLLMMSPPQ